MSSGLSSSRRLPSFPRRRRHGLLTSAVAAAIEPLESRICLSAALLPTGDTFVRNHEYRSTNLGASPILGVKTPSSGDARTTFLKFDLAGVGANIATATLRVTASLQNPEGGPVVTGAFGVEDTDWVEGNGQWAYRDRTSQTLDTSRRITGHGDGYDRDGLPDGEMTWNNQPASDTVPIDTIAVGSDLMRTYEFDLTGYVLAARRGGDREVSVALKNPQPTDFFTRVLSGEFPGGEPVLVITEGTDAPPPLPRVTAPDITSGGGSSYSFDVDYSGAGLSAGDVGTDDVTVLDSAGRAVAVTGVTTTARGNALTARYEIAAPGGGWDSADNGVYRVTVKTGGVSGAGGASVGALSEFRVAVGDNAAPTVSIAPVIPKAGETTFAFTATFTDDVAIDPATINLNNFEVDAPNGTGLGFTRVTPDRDEPSRTIVATYATEAPGGPDNIGWRPEFDGTWDIILRDNQVRDTAGNGVARSTQSFEVNLGSTDSTGPAATISADEITSAGGTSQTIRVDYTDPAGFDMSSFGTTDITVAGPSGALDVTSVALAPGSTQTTRGVLYTVAAPGGTWDAADAGTYTVSLDAGEVKDASGNVAAPVTGTFGVQPVGPDRQGPDGSVQVADVTSAGNDPITVTVTYTDDVAVDPSSVDSTDLTVSGAGGDLDVTGAAVRPGAGGSTTVVDYTVAPPSGGFAAGANGQYTVTVAGGAVRDTAGNPGTSVSANFNVNVPGSADPRDPTFNTSAVDFSAQGVATQSDGKIVVVGYLGTAGSSDARAVIERRNPNGTIDESFGNDGRIISAAGSADSYHAVVVESGDRIVAAGRRGGDLIVTRLTSAGAPDATFGAGGTAVADFGSDNEAAYGLAITPDGNLVAVGESDGNFAVARFTATGAPDVSFAQGGRQLYGVGEASDGLGAVALQGDGKVVAAGARGAAVAVIRLGTNGELDPGFSGDGVLLVGGLTAARGDGETPDHSQAIAIQPDGRIVVSNRTPDGDFGLARVTPGGNLDSTFGDDGLAVAGFEGEADVDALVVQPTGQILAIGTAKVGELIRTGVAAFNGNGQLITSFGEGGRVTIEAQIAPIERELRIGNLVLRAFGTRQPDGRLVLGAGSRDARSGSSSISRLLVPGSTRAPSPTPPGGGGGVGASETNLGQFGMVDGKKTKFSWTDADGTVAQIVLTGGSGTAYTADGSALRLAITDGGAGAKLSLKARGGNGRIVLGDVTVTGSLKTLTAKPADVTGAVFATGAIGNVNVGNLAGGTVASAGGAIGTVSAFSLSDARILSGANLGNDGHLGGGDDSFAGGSIKAVKVAGNISATVIGAGYDSGGDGDFLDGNNSVAAGSVIRSITAKAGADNASRFAASTFGNVKLPGRVDPTTDGRFKLA